jgi:hypothetical protein
MPATATKPEIKVTPIGSVKAKYRWESKVGERRGHNCLIDVYQDAWIHPKPDEEVTAKIQSAAWERRYTAEEKEIIKQAYLDNGSDMIHFTYERGPENDRGQATTGHVWFATNSDAVAWVVRRHIAENDLGKFTEMSNVNAKTYKVGDKVFADTPTGKRLAFEEVDATGGTLEVVTPAVTD